MNSAFNIAGSFFSLDALVPFARLRAQRGFYNGIMNEASQKLMRLCTHRFNFSPERGAIILFTRDTGHHLSGWFKNPDYERCWHLSISYRQHHEGSEIVDRHIEHDMKMSEHIAREFYGDDTRLVWCEPPYSPEGKRIGVWHYRLFANPAWGAIKPRGEVYNNRDTPANWQSFQELHGYKPSPENAPFFSLASE